MQDCGRAAWLWANPITGKWKVTSKHCQDALCPACSRERQHTIADALTKWTTARNLEHPLKFITLTLAASTAPLDQQVQNLKKAFKRLRGRRFWKQRIEGGIWFFELTWSTESSMWHPHLHVIAEGSYIPQSILADEWKLVTHGSYIVDVRAVKDRRTAFGYVAKYVAKNHNLTELPTPQALEVLTMLAKVATNRPFGNWHQQAPLKTPVEPMDDWHLVASVDRLFTRARGGDGASLALLYDSGILKPPKQESARGSPVTKIA